MGSAASKPSAPAPESPVAEKQSVQAVTEALSAVRLAGPSSANGTLTADAISQWEQQVASEPSVELARTILNHTDVRQALISRKAVVADQHVFNTELKFKTGPITAQKSSGRCWLFATTNVLRYNVMKKFNLEEFQLSQVSSVTIKLVFKCITKNGCSRICSSTISSTRPTTTSSS